MAPNLTFIIHLTCPTVKFRLGINIQNSISHVNERNELLVSNELAPTQAMKTNSTRRPQQKGTTFNLCL